MCGVHFIKCGSGSTDFLSGLLRTLSKFIVTPDFTVYKPYDLYLIVNLRIPGMSNKRKQQKDLEQLKYFVLNPPVHDHVSYLWYYSLRTRYPFQYLQLMKQYRHLQKDNSVRQLDNDNIKEVVQWINRLYGDLTQYFIKPPQNEEQEKNFINKVNFLEELLLKQTREN